MKLLTFNELQETKGVPYPRVHIWRLVKADGFPSPVPLSAGRHAWLESEIDDWIKSRAAARETAAA